MTALKVCQHRDERESKSILSNMKEHSEYTAINISTKIMRNTL